MQKPAAGRSNGNIILSISLVCCASLHILHAAEPVLEGTSRLIEEADLSEKMVSAWHDELDRRLQESIVNRRQFWKYDLSTTERYELSISANRERLKKILGVVDERQSPRLEFVSDEPVDAKVVNAGSVNISTVRWSVIDGIHGEGFLLMPPGKPRACVVSLGDADHLPEQLIGLKNNAMHPVIPWASELARNGCAVIVPTLIDRDCIHSGVAAIAMTNEPHREWIYRQAYEMGRHIIGYEIQKTLAAVDWFRKTHGVGVPVAVAGYGEGGLLAFYSAAIDTRIEACLVSGYFGPREKLWQEPVYRNVWSLLQEFGDAEIATLIAPRKLLIEVRPVPDINGPPEAQPPVRLVAASGSLETPSLEDVRREFDRIFTLFPVDDGQELPAIWKSWAQLVNGVSENLTDSTTEQNPASNTLAQWLHEWIPEWQSLDAPAQIGGFKSSSTPADRQERAIHEIERHVRRLIWDSDQVRRQFMLDRCDLSSLESLIKDLKQYRQQFQEEVIGQLEGPDIPPNARSRIYAESEKWTAYEIVLDFWSDTFCWGILVVPKDLAHGERRPVVVCQHGLEGLPSSTLTTEGRGYQSYRAFAARLAERGFVTFAPHNPYRGQDRFMTLQRKLNPLKASLGSIIVAQHEQILNWLESLPFVDPHRIGFYGLSYGGWTASRIPAIIERYKLSICSACFNDWVRKTASTEYLFCYPYHTQYEMPEWNLGHTFNNAEMAYLMIPRAFMVERGHHDGVSIDSWVAGEYAKVRWLYTQVGLADKTRIEYFNGGHIINGQGTYDFLHEQLDFPVATSTQK